VLICHAESKLNREAIAGWMAAHSDLVGIILIKETFSASWRRIRYEIRRVGLLRFLDVLAFRLYYAIILARNDAAWLRVRLIEHHQTYPANTLVSEVLCTRDPNSVEVEAFIRRQRPDYVIARCKCILIESIYSIPRHGTFVLHPGICPEYRNAHGAFWALATDDLDRVGLTLLKIDRGIDTGPAYGYFRCKYDELRESHIVIMTKLALDNLDGIRDLLIEICEGRAVAIDAAGRSSSTWGQPWLSAYLRWKRQARRRHDARART
jgi:hypothetical protein